MSGLCQKSNNGTNSRIFVRKFSERYGYKKIKKIIQKETMGPALKNSLWSCLIINFWEPVNGSWSGYGLEDKFEKMFRSLWLHHYKLPLDNLPEFEYKSDLEDTIEGIKKEFYESKSYEIYDLIEFLANDKSVTPTKSKKFQSEVNYYLERELSAYRFVMAKSLKSLQT